MLNEEQYIVRCLENLVRLDYPYYEIIVVDDESTDASFNLASAFAETTDVPISVIKVPEKPAGWVGKTWPCMIGRRHATGTLLLFTDADTIHEKWTLKAAVNRLREKNADVLTLITRLVLPGRWVRMTIPLVTAFKLVYPEGVVNFDVREVNKAGTENGIIIGSYYLTRSVTYDRIGGHASVKGHIIEDLYIGRRIKKMGFRLLIADGSNGVEAIWSRDLRSLYNSLARLMVTMAARNRFKAALCWVQLALLLVSPHLSTAISLLVALDDGSSYNTYYNTSFLLASLAAFFSQTGSFIQQARIQRIPWLYCMTACIGSIVAMCGFSGGMGARTKWRSREYRCRTEDAC